MSVLDDEEMIRIYRQQRHDFLNYIQIILGYLQIDQKDRAIDYIHKIINEINEERSIFLLNTQSI
ncbi:MAG: Spo0B domain-containing protein, partial [Thermoanaerobacterium sp.]|nr:Spo0B domain-containing protein [Thermoanaerobacterium sp.]